MKKLIALLTLLTAFAAHSVELQMQECTFGTSTMDFMPSQTLTSILKKKVKGAVVYKVKYKIGNVDAGPKEDLAIVKELSNKSLEVKFFELDEQEKLIYKKYVVSVYLSSPTKTERPIIIFSSSLYDDMPFKGKCSLMF